MGLHAQTGDLDTEVSASNMVVKGKNGGREKRDEGSALQPEDEPPKAPPKHLPSTSSAPISLNLFFSVF